jgi:hypothetical protein
MKFAALFVAFSLGTSAFASSPTDIVITCKGNIGSSTVNHALTFGGANPSTQDFASYNNVTYSIQLGSYLGFIDILMVQTVMDEKGKQTAGGYIRTHGGTALDLVDPAKHINLTCNMTGP